MVAELSYSYAQSYRATGVPHFRLGSNLLKTLVSNLPFGMMIAHRESGETRSAKPLVFDLVVSDYRLVIRSNLWLSGHSHGNL